MARLAILVALLAHLQPALATFYTVTSYYELTMTVSKWPSTCSDDCDYFTYTDSLTVKPTVTPTAKPASTSTYTYTYDDIEIVYVYLSPGAVNSADLVPTSTSTGANTIYTDFAVPVTWTAPSSCPTPFTVVTAQVVYVPNQVAPHLKPKSSSSSIWTNTYRSTASVVTWLTLYIDATDVPEKSRPPATPTDYEYSYYVKSCSNPTASPTYGSGSGSGSSSGSGGSRSGGSDDDDWTVCSVMTGCVSLATWIIVVATILPTIFVLGFVESYFWFRRLMLGKSALRLGTVCWCALSLWVICLTRKSHERSKEDQVLLKQYWATLGAGTRLKYWFKYGFRWRYPVELLGNPDGNNPVVMVAAPPPPGQGPPGQQGDGTVGDGSEKTQAFAQQQPVFTPYPGQPYQPYPGQPGDAPPQGYGMMPAAPQGAYVPGQQPGFVPAPQMGDGQQQQGQQQYPPFMPTPSPAPTGTTELPSNQPTPPPGHEHQQPAPQELGQQQQHQQPAPQELGQQQHQQPHP